MSYGNSVFTGELELSVWFLLELLAKYKTLDSRKDSISNKDCRSFIFFGCGGGGGQHD